MVLVLVVVVMVMLVVKDEVDLFLKIVSVHKSFNTDCKKWKPSVKTIFQDKTSFDKLSCCFTINMK